MVRLNAAARDGCRLEVELQPHEGRLRLAYRFENGSLNNAYLFNRLYRQEEHGRVFGTESAPLIYASASGTLSLRIIPVPDDLRVEYREVPCTTCVGAGQSFEETMVLPLPLTPYSPYSDMERMGVDAEVQPRHPSFELGYFLAPPEGDGLAIEVPLPQGKAYRFRSFPHYSQQILRVGPTPFTVPVRS